MAKQVNNDKLTGRKWYF